MKRIFKKEKKKKLKKKKKDKTDNDMKHHLVLRFLSEHSIPFHSIPKCLSFQGGAHLVLNVL